MPLGGGSIHRILARLERVEQVRTRDNPERPARHCAGGLTHPLSPRRFCLGSSPCHEKKANPCQTANRRVSG